METIKEFCEKMKITIPIYYKIFKRNRKRPTEEDVLEHKRTARTGRPRKESL